MKEIFDELLQAIVETPSLLKDGPSGNSKGARGGVGVNLSGKERGWEHCDKELLLLV